MFYKFSLPKVGTLLVIAGLVFSSTSTFAQSEAVNPEPAVTVDANTANHRLLYACGKLNSSTENLL